MNWSGGVRWQPRQVIAPADATDLAATLADAAERGETVRAVGSGHSFTPLAATDGVQVRLDRLAGVWAVHPERGTVTVGGGTPLARLGADLLELGLAQSNLGDIDAQTVAGAIATATHGTSATIGGLADQVRGLTIATPGGELVDCDAEHRPERFRAAQVGLGVIGVVAAVELAVEPAYRLAYRTERVDVDEALDAFEELAAAHRHTEIFWMPHSRWALRKRADRTDAPAVPDRRRALVEAGVENAALWALSETARAVPRLAPSAARLAGRAITPTSGVDHSHRVFATRRSVRFEECEYALPRDALQPALAALRAWLADTQYPVHFPVEVRVAPPSAAWLSPAYGRDTAYVAVHAYRGMAYRDYFLAAEEIFAAHDGRPHWGKQHSLAPASLRRRYPHYKDFLAERAAIDPQGVLLSPYTSRLLGISAGSSPPVSPERPYRSST